MADVGSGHQLCQKSRRDGLRLEAMIKEHGFLQVKSERKVQAAATREGWAEASPTLT